MLAWGAWRLLSAVLPARFYREVDDRLYTIYQSMVLFFFENYTGVQVSRAGQGKEGTRPGVPSLSPVPPPREPAAVGDVGRGLPGRRLPPARPAAFWFSGRSGGREAVGLSRARPPPCEVGGPGRCGLCLWPFPGTGEAGRGVNTVRVLRIGRGQACVTSGDAFHGVCWCCVRFAGRGNGRDATPVVLCQLLNGGSRLCTLEPCGLCCTSVVLNWYQIREL